MPYTIPKSPFLWVGFQPSKKNASCLVKALRCQHDARKNGSMDWPKKIIHDFTSFIQSNRRFQCPPLSPSFHPKKKQQTASFPQIHGVVFPKKTEAAPSSLGSTFTSSVASGTASGTSVGSGASGSVSTDSAGLGSLGWPGSCWGLKKGELWWSWACERKWMKSPMIDPEFLWNHWRIEIQPARITPWNCHSFGMVISYIQLSIQLPGLNGSFAGRHSLTLGWEVLPAHHKSRTSQVLKKMGWRICSSGV